MFTDPEAPLRGLVTCVAESVGVTDPALYFTDLRGPTNVQAHHTPRRVRKRKSRASLDMAIRLEAIATAARQGNPHRAALASRLGRRIQSCAISVDGWRCKTVMCPRCACRTARNHRARVERLLDRPEELGFLTLTSVHADLSRGLTTLKRAFSELRRRVVWSKTVSGGDAFIELRRVDSSRRKPPQQFRDVTAERAGFENGRRRRAA
jgi:hypothetical protein